MSLRSSSRDLGRLSLSVLRRYAIPLGAFGAFLVFLLATPTGVPVSAPVAPQSSDGIEVLVPTFRDATLETGVIFSHLQGDEHLTGINETLGAGVCAFDYDNDGWIDLYLVNGTGQTRYYGLQHWWQLPKGNALYRNVGGKRFEDVTSAAGLRGQTWGMGCASADFDNDGHRDLLTTNFGSLRLYRNLGNGRFADVSEASGLNSSLWATSAALADYDGDGLLDIYVANYVDFAKGAHTYEDATQYIREFPRAFHPHLYAGVADRLYRNKGGLAFEDVTASAGVHEESGRTLAAAWLDADEDSRPDLLVANDTGTTTFFYANRGRGKFEEIGLALLLNDAQGSHALSVGDINRDGRMDIAVSPAGGEVPLLMMNERSESGSRIFRNRARQLGLAANEESAGVGWGLELADFNNDGLLDLFQASGMLVPDPSTDKVTQGQSKRLWVQVRNGSYREVSAAAGSALSDTQSARGVAVADYDNDGDLDIYIAHNNDLGQLLRNETSAGHWIGIELEGRRGNRDAIGARIELAAGGQRQYRVVGSDGFLSNGDHRAHFGLAAYAAEVDVTIRWPDGSNQAHRKLATGRYVRIAQGDSKVRELRAAPASNTAANSGLRVGANRPEYRLRYLRWVAMQDTAASGAELRNALGDDDVRVRTLAIELITEHKSAEGLSLLIGALEDRDPQVRMAALEAVRQHEDEASIRWLLRLFRDPNAGVRVALAEAFAFFYRKEEAIVYRKYLALPYLIRMTADPEGEVRRAAARAIGEAKRYEGIDPLQALLTDPVEAVRAEAACSLGLIRDRKALPALRRIVDDAAAAPVQRAHALIALQRLNALRSADLARTVENGLRAHDREATRRTFAMLDEIFGNAIHGIVLDRKLLTQTLLAAAEAGTFTDPSLHEPLVGTLRLAGSPRVVPLLAKFTRSSDPKVRELAYLALLAVDRASRPNHYARALVDPSIEVRLRLLQELEKDVVRPSVSSLLVTLDDPHTRAAAIRIVRGTRDAQTQRALAGIAQDAHERIELRVAAIDALVAAGPGSPTVPVALLHADDPELRAAAVRWWGAQLPFYVRSPTVPQELREALHDANRTVSTAAIDVLHTRHEAWAAEYLQATLLDASADVGLRRRILNGLSQRPAALPSRALTVLAERKNDPLRYPAVNALEPSDEEARALLWKILRDRAENVDLRFAAATRLKPLDGKAVIEALRTG